MHKGWSHIYPVAQRPYPAVSLARYAAHLFPQPFARQRLLDTFLFARLEVERMFLNILNYVFLLNLAFEAPKGAFEGFPFI
jgi:hypothetical protein